jgi:hypothetical protein
VKTATPRLNRVTPQTRRIEKPSPFARREIREHGGAVMSPRTRDVLRRVVCGDAIRVRGERIDKGDEHRSACADGR